MEATKPAKRKSELLFPGNRKVSISEYRSNIARAERSDNMTFDEFKSRIDVWEKTL
jgi:hypothetical protein